MGKTKKGPGGTTQQERLSAVRRGKPFFIWLEQLEIEKNMLFD